MIKNIIAKMKNFVLRGNRFFCPLCEKSFRKFHTYGINPRPNARCPECGSLERHRLLWLAIINLQEKGIIQRGGCLLHVAPEKCLRQKFIRQYDYTSIDLDGKKAMIAMDITRIDFEDDYFDAIVCNHVLEHVPDDRRAINELYRVLKPGGWASIQVPILGNVTDEDLSVTNPNERLRLYGKEDHVRHYGIDFIDRIQDSGFKVLLISKNDLLETGELETISVACEKEVILCRK